MLLQVQQAMLHVQQAMLHVHQAMLHMQQAMLHVQHAKLSENNNKANLSPAELELGLSLVIIGCILSSLWKILLSSLQPSFFGFLMFRWLIFSSIAQYCSFHFSVLQ